MGALSQNSIEMKQHDRQRYANSKQLKQRPSEKAVFMVKNSLSDGLYCKQILFSEFLQPVSRYQKLV